MKKLLFIFAAALLLCACENEHNSKYSVYRKEYRSDFNYFELDGEAFKSQDWIQFDYCYSRNGDGIFTRGAQTFRADNGEFTGAIENVSDKSITYLQKGQIVVINYKDSRDTLLSFGDSIDVHGRMYYYYGPSEP